ncbi:hypothetical protein RhiirA4_498231 [Rhizophagus irregularis]|uniref:Uncharacterized protein n=1 Tax=Rhizophagus irregularis TaxID=588596 RepID=A0A2I1H2J0_9GLOM|nr:hypothetical protein RhiirA4_498231 [Rhizophagus irregularis]
MFGFIKSLKKRLLAPLKDNEKPLVEDEDNNNLNEDTNEENIENILEKIEKSPGGNPQDSSILTPHDKPSKSRGKLGWFGWDEYMGRDGKISHSESPRHTI